MRGRHVHFAGKVIKVKRVFGAINQVNCPAHNAVVIGLIGVQNGVHLCHALNLGAVRAQRDPKLAL